MSASYYGGWPGGPPTAPNWLRAMQQPGTTPPAGADPNSPAKYDPWAMMQAATGTDQGAAYDWSGGPGGLASSPADSWAAYAPGMDANAIAQMKVADGTTPGLTDKGFDTWLSGMYGDPNAPPQERRFGPIPEPIGNPLPGEQPYRFDDPRGFVPRQPGPIPEPIGNAAPPSDPSGRNWRGGPVPEPIGNPLPGEQPFRFDAPEQGPPGGFRTPPTPPSMPGDGPASIGNDPGYVPPPPGGMPAPAPQTGPAQTANWGSIYGQRPGAVNADIWGDVSLQNQFNQTGNQGYAQGFENLADTMADQGSVYNNWLNDQRDWALTQWDNFNAGNPGTSSWTDFLTGRAPDPVAGDDTPPTSPNMRQRLQDRYLQLPGWMQGMTRGNGGGFAGAMLGGYGGG